MSNTLLLSPGLKAGHDSFCKGADPGSVCAVPTQPWETELRQAINFYMNYESTISWSQTQATASLRTQSDDL